MGRQADTIAEGLAIVHAAARLALKNRILVDTIAQGETFDPTHFVPSAHDVLTELALEAEEHAADLSRMRKAAWGKHSQSRGTHDYRDRDVRNLRRRMRQSEGVAKALRTEAEDDDAMLELVERARESAWDDVRKSLDTKLRVEAMRPDEDPDYQKMRGARMQALRLVDLQKLAVQTKARREAEG
ncbi:MAG: asparagine synthase [Microbacterium sp.]